MEVKDQNLLLDQEWVQEYPTPYKSALESLVRYGHLKVHASSSTPVQEQILEEFSVTKMLDFDDVHEFPGDLYPKEFEHVPEPIISGVSDADVPQSFPRSSSSSGSPHQGVPSRIGRIDKPSSFDMGGTFSIFPNCDGDCPMFPKAQRKHSSTSTSTVSLDIPTPTPALVKSTFTSPKDSRRIHSFVTFKSSTSSAPSTPESTTRESRTISEIPPEEVKNSHGQSSGFWIFPDCDGDCPSFPKAHRKLNPIRIAPLHSSTESLENLSLHNDRAPDQDKETNIPESVAFQQESMTRTQVPRQGKVEVEEDYNFDAFSVFPDCDGDCPGFPHAVKKN